MTRTTRDLSMLSAFLFGGCGASPESQQADVTQEIAQQTTRLTTESKPVGNGTSQGTTNRVQPCRGKSNCVTDTVGLCTGTLEWNGTNYVATTEIKFPIAGVMDPLSVSVTPNVARKLEVAWFPGSSPSPPYVVSEPFSSTARVVTVEHKCCYATPLGTRWLFNCSPVFNTSR